MEFGEWKKEIGSGGNTVLIVTDNDAVVIVLPIEFEDIADRIVACVNACAGMDDPEWEIAKLKEKAWMYDDLCK